MENPFHEKFTEKSESVLSFIDGWLTQFPIK